MAYQLNKQTMEINPIESGSTRSKLTFGKMITSIFVGLFVTLISFQSNAESSKDFFKTNCSTCHSTGDKTVLGPGLKGLSERRSEEWIMKWVRNSTELIESGDKDAVQLFADFNKIPMASFDLSDEELKALIAYIDEAGAAEGTVASTDVVATTEEGTKPMNTQILFWGVLFILAVALYMYKFVRKIKNRVSEMGIHPDAHKVKNYPGIFALMLIIALGAIYVLINLLDQNNGMINILMFLVLPYVAFAIFIVGSIYRYTKRGFQVSSLSSQFIEGKQLFWGSQPFHWGILVLFVGHLTAFLFPRAILAWNGEPVRLLILELSSFAFGLAALLGLILLIKRRLTNKSLLVVTNKMDMVVYVILLIQLVSGLGVAFFVRWGSSWFSSVLTPYLRSVFSFDPDISSVSAMPWWIQLHIISAFLIIAIIPFTRFMHFLVAPIDYIWRKYQLVIWNWNRKEIRNSKQHTFGKKPRNH